MSTEVSWFSALCDDDYDFLGVPDPKLRSSWEHCREIVLRADRNGFDNILLPSGYGLGIHFHGEFLDLTLDPPGARTRSGRCPSLDSASVGVRRQAELREQAADEGFVEENLWTGVGRARSECGAAIVGDPDQVRTKLRAYEELGIEAFVLSGYPHLDECDHFARYVLPGLDHGPLS